jgi:hypothetical protein
MGYKNDPEQVNHLLTWCNDLIHRGRVILARGLPSTTDAKLEYDMWRNEYYDFDKESGDNVASIYECGFVPKVPTPEYEARQYKEQMINRLGRLQATQRRLQRVQPAKSARQVAKGMEQPDRDVAAFQRQLAEHKRTLAKLQEKRAKYTELEAPVHLLTQIEDEEQEIACIKDELRRLEG